MEFQESGPVRRVVDWIDKEEGDLTIMLLIAVVATGIQLARIIDFDKFAANVGLKEEPQTVLSDEALSED